MDLYHVLNRGVDKRTIFLESGDYIRFIQDLYHFNDTAPAYNTSRIHDIVSRVLDRKRERLVDIHGWCLMGNHYHLLLSERTEGGLSKFVRKLNVGYAKYFNEKYDRVGTLFQGRTKKILIDTDAHFLHILNYIHLNPLDFSKEDQSWREQPIQNVENAMAYLLKYRWSSFLDYCGRRNFPSILTTSLYDDVFVDCEKQIRKYLIGNGTKTLLANFSLE